MASERRPGSFEPFDEELSNHYLQSSGPLTSPNGSTGTSYYDEMSPVARARLSPHTPSHTPLLRLLHGYGELDVLSHWRGGLSST